jgi:molybdopterin molybdotransferase
MPPLLPVEDAQALLLDPVAPLDARMLPLAAAAGRILADDLSARLDQPPADMSAMDGYALRAADLPGPLAVVGEAAAGHGHPRPLGAGEAVRIFTGAPVPEGADSIVIQENAQAADGRVTFQSAATPGRHIRAAGIDFSEGATLLAAGTRLDARHLALTAAMGHATLPVHRRPRVGILATGDELVRPGEPARPDQIVASNGFALAAMAEALGARARMLPIARDREASLRQCLALAAGADVIVTIGGASVGDHDLVGKVAADLGMERAFWKIAMRPGKPLMAGRLGGAVMLGLPGNPVSAFVCGHLFMLPLLAAMQGLPGEVATQRAVLAGDLPANGPRAHYMRAGLEPGDGALPRITPFESQDSARLRLLAEAAALLVRPEEDGPRSAGSVVEYIPL